MKFWEINNAIKEEMRLDPGLVLDSERTRFINDCMDNIGALQLIELTVTQTLVVSQYPTSPTGLGKIRSLYWNDVKLAMLPSDKDVNSTGEPIGYILEADSVRLYPKPMAPGSLRWTYTGTPPYVTEAILTDETSSSEPALPVSWHSLLIEYACHRSHRKNGNILMANQYKKDYDSNMASKVRAYVSSLNSRRLDSSKPEEGGGDY